MLLVRFCFSFEITYFRETTLRTFRLNLITIYCFQSIYDDQTNNLLVRKKNQNFKNPFIGFVSTNYFFDEKNFRRKKFRRKKFSTKMFFDQDVFNFLVFDEKNFRRREFSTKKIGAVSSGRSTSLAGQTSKTVSIGHSNKSTSHNE